MIYNCGQDINKTVSFVVKFRKARRPTASPRFSSSSRLRHGPLPLGKVGNRCPRLPATWKAVVQMPAPGHWAGSGHLLSGSRTIAQPDHFALDRRPDTFRVCRPMDFPADSWADSETMVVPAIAESASLSSAGVASFGAPRAPWKDQPKWSGGRRGIPGGSTGSGERGRPFGPCSAAVSRRTWPRRPAPFSARVHTLIES